MTSMLSDSEGACRAIKRLNTRLPVDAVQVRRDLVTLMHTIRSPLFVTLLHIQDSLVQIGQLSHSNLITTQDFRLDEEGKLVLDKPISGGIALPEVDVSDISSIHSDGPLMTVRDPVEEMRQLEAKIAELACGRLMEKITLVKDKSGSLGFGVVGLQAERRKRVRIYVQDIKPGGVADRDGRLREGDEILALDGHLFAGNLTLRQATSALQASPPTVHIVVAHHLLDSSNPTSPRRSNKPRGARLTSPRHSSVQPPPPPPHRVKPALPERPPRQSPGQGDESGLASPAGSNSPKQDQTLGDSGPPQDFNLADMVLSTDWTQLEVINLINDGTGLGFGIIGGKSTGVVVKTIIPGGVADRDGRLHSGDHILQIGDINVRGMGSEQVASVLRQSGVHVRLIVARAVVEPLPEYPAYAPIIPTDHLSEHVVQLNAILNGFVITPDGTMQPATDQLAAAESSANQLIGSAADQLAAGAASQLTAAAMLDSSGRDITLPAEIHPVPQIQVAQPSALHLGSDVEQFNVELVKDDHGLGITIAGYVTDNATNGNGAEKDEISGVFISSITEGSAAALCGHIRVHDQIIAVDSQSLEGFTNQQAVEVLRNTGKVVILRLTRYRQGGPSQIFKSFAMTDLSTQSLDPGAISLSASTFQNPENESRTEHEEEALIKQKWIAIVGDAFDIIIAQVRKFKEGGGLGVSLEGTVDVENGVEVHPHHYIRSILPEGPVGLDGRLKNGDELLEVNGIKLLGRNHIEVVSILKDLPQHVRVVCARRKLSSTLPGSPREDQPPISLTSSSSNVSMIERLFKAKSDQELFVANGVFSSPPPGVSVDSSESSSPKQLWNGSRLKSRSLEPLSGLAMWTTDVINVELEKGERGLGFSILDYQDPINHDETVIVIRSLVPGGVAQLDGRLVPGDRLVYVNEVNLEKASLDDAVQTLKSTPRGLVRLGVAKPLPLSEVMTGSQDGAVDHCIIDAVRLEAAERAAESAGSAGQTAAVTARSVSPPSSRSACSSPTNYPHEVPPPVVPAAQAVRASGLSLELSKVHVTSPEKKSSPSQNKQSPPTAPATIIYSPDGSRGRVRSPGGSGGPTSPTSGVKPSVPPKPTTLPTSAASAQVKSSALQSPRTEVLAGLDKKILDLTSNIVLKRKASEPLGIQLQATNSFSAIGCVVQYVMTNQVAGRDGRLKVGDLVLCVGGETLQGITNAQARAALRKASMSATEISITYIAQAQLQDLNPLCDKAPSAQKSSSNSATNIEPVLCNDNINSNIDDDDDDDETTESDFLLRKDKTENLSATAISIPVRDDNLNLVSTQNSANPELTLDVSSLPGVNQQLPSNTEEVGHSSAAASTQQTTNFINRSLELLGTCSCGKSVPCSPLLGHAASRDHIVTSRSLDMTSLGHSMTSQPQTVTSRSLDMTSEMTSADDRLLAHGAHSSSHLGNCVGHQFSGLQASSTNPHQALAGFSGPISHNNHSTASYRRASLQLRGSSTSKQFASHGASGRRRQSSSVIDSSGKRLETLVEDRKMNKSTSGLWMKSNGGAKMKEGIAIQSERTVTDDIDYVLYRCSVVDRKLSDNNRGISESENSQVIDPAYKSLSSEGTLHRILLNIQPVQHLSNSPDGHSSSDNQQMSPHVKNSQSSVFSESSKLGLGLSGHRDPNVMGVFVAGLVQDGPAAKDGRIHVGDQLLEINGCNLLHRCHLSVPAIVNGISQSSIDVLLLRRPDFQKHMACSWQITGLQNYVCDLNKGAEISDTAPSNPLSSENDWQSSSSCLTLSNKELPNNELLGALPAISQTNSERISPGAENVVDTKLANSNEQPKLDNVRTRNDDENNVSTDVADHKEDIITDSSICKTQNLSPSSQNRVSGHQTHSNTDETNAAVPNNDNIDRHNTSNSQSKSSQLINKSSKTFDCSSEENTPVLRDSRKYSLDVLETTRGQAESEPLHEISNGKTNKNISNYSNDRTKEINSSTHRASLCKEYDSVFTPASISRNKSGYCEDSFESEMENVLENAYSFELVSKNKNTTSKSICSGSGYNSSNISTASDSQTSGYTNDEVASTNSRNTLIDQVERKPKIEPFSSASKSVAADDLRALYDGQSTTTKAQAVSSKHVAPAGDEIERRDVDETSARLEAGAELKQAGPGGEKEKKRHGRLKVPRGERLRSHYSSSSTSSSFDASGLDSATAGPATTSGLQQRCQSSAAASSSRRRTASSGGKRPSKKASHSVQDERACAIVPGKETYIEINKNAQTALGLDIIGGIYSIPGVVMVNEVYKNGAAAKDGRLMIGDQLLEVNGENLCDVTDDWAREMLIHTSKPIRLLVYRDPTPLLEGEIYEIFSLDLVKKPNRGLGFTVVSRAVDQGIFVADIIKGGTAEADGQLVSGDRILVVNGVDVRNCTLCEAAEILKTVIGRVCMTIGRVKCLLGSMSQDGSSLDVDTDEEVQIYLDDASSKGPT